MTKGLVELKKEVVEIGAIVESAVEQSRPQLDHKMHSLVVQDDGSQPCVLGDRNRLVQSIVNLLNNAAKYTPENGRIALSVRTDGERVLVEVEDSGIGIDAGLLPQVFELFTQAERTPDRAQGGLGIRLALVRTIVNLHGGEIAAHSPGLGRGSTFRLSLPLLGRSEALTR